MCACVYAHLAELSLAQLEASNMLQLKLSAACSRHLLSAPATSTSPLMCKITSPSWVVCATADRSLSKAGATDLPFQPFVEVKDHMLKIQTSPNSDSFARHHYSTACEKCINCHIGFEFCLSYTYEAIFAYFDRDNVGLLGFAAFFNGLHLKHRARAELLMEHQNERGGKVVLLKLEGPRHTEFDDKGSGDALHAMEYTLALTMETNDNLLKLHEVAKIEDDAELQDFLEEDFLKPQVEYMKKISEYVSQLRRLGQGHGVYHFDMLLQKQLQENL